jgi:hypothetical protein
MISTVFTFRVDFAEMRATIYSLCLDSGQVRNCLLNKTLSTAIELKIHIIVICN